MLSSILNSKRAVQVNIAIVHAFARLREILATHKDLVRKLEDLERKYAVHHVRIQQVFFLHQEAHGATRLFRRAGGSALFLPKKSSL